MAEILRCDSCGATSRPHLAPWWATVGSVAGAAQDLDAYHACSSPCLIGLARHFPHLSAEPLNAPEAETNDEQPPRVRTTSAFRGGG